MRVQAVVTAMQNQTPPETEANFTQYQCKTDLKPTKSRATT
jgi:hypothetical protein